MQAKGSRNTFHQNGIAIHTNRGLIIVIPESLERSLCPRFVRHNNSSANTLVYSSFLAAMWHTLQLLLPALVPSWRFFDYIAASPRIQFTLFNAADDTPHTWHEFRPRPAHVPFKKMLARLIWNPYWNESLFLVSCAERLIASPTQHSEDEILKRIMAELMSQHSVNNAMATHLQFRLLLVKRNGSQLQHTVAYYSRTQPFARHALK